MTDRFKHFTINKSKNKDLSKKFKSDPDFKKQVTYTIIDFVSMLGYDTLKSTPIYAIIDKDTFQNIKWLHATNSERYQNIYNYKEKRFEYKPVFYDVWNRILLHSFPLELKNRTKYNNRAFYSNDVNEEILFNMHYFDDTMCGCSFKEMTDVLAVDIDVHNGEGSLYSYQILQSFIEFIKSDPIYLEISPVGSYHAFFKLDKEYSTYERSTIINDFNSKYGYSIKYENTMRFPNSISYTPFTVDGEVLDYLEAIKLATEAYNTKQSQEIKSTIETIIEESPKSKERIEKKQYIISDIYSRVHKNKINHITPEEALQDESLNICTSNRHFPMLSIIRVAKFNNWTKDETLSFIRQKDNPLMPSKDLSRWNDSQLMKQIDKIWDSCKMTYVESIEAQPEKFISNLEHIPSNILSLINEKFIKTILNQVFIYSREYRTTKKNIKSFEIVFKEMLGYIYYNSKNNKILKGDFNKKLLIGYQFSDAFFYTMKRHYPELKKVDVRTVGNCIMKFSGYFTQYYTNAQGWRWNEKDMTRNFCRQFDIHTNTSHILLNNKDSISYIIHNSIKKYITLFSIINKLSNNNYTKITYYIKYFSNYVVDRGVELRDFDVGWS